MSGILTGNRLQTVSGVAVAVEGLLGAGGQGEVYRASVGGAPIAVKWFYEHTATATLRQGIETLVRTGAPSPAFVWPEDMVADPSGGPSFGYVMRLREPRFRSFVELVTRRVEPTFKVLACAGFELASNFLLLHSKGLCYQDINFDNIFLDPKTGEILIIDNDNVKVNDPSIPGNIRGTMRFMAPEVVVGKAVPSTDTDLFSLSVLLFYMLMVNHPLDGAREQAYHCTDEPAMTKLYGDNPVFIFDPADTSNRPVPGAHDNALVFWDLYPQFLRDRFTEAFTKGIRDSKNGRIRESVWTQSMMRLWESIILCGHCGAENFYDAERLAAQGNASNGCWSCQRPLSLPFRIRLEDKSVVMLNHDSVLLPHHVNPSMPMKMGAPPAAQVTKHPSDPNIWGLRNCTQQKWVWALPDGTIRDVPPGKSVTLASGNKIHFGPTTGEIRG